MIERDEYFKREFKKKSKMNASQEYLDYIYALSLIQGSNKEHKKVTSKMFKYFKLLTNNSDINPDKVLKITIAKAWINGFNFCFLARGKI
ncbi:MAG: hypothetical protein AABY22_02330 [Nanoarchaeota archaeon]